MKTIQQVANITLIKGKFEPTDAKDLVMNFINSKINYHKLKSFSLLERSGKRDKHSEDRITELTDSRNELVEIIKEANDNGLKVKIDSTIKIRLVK